MAADHRLGRRRKKSVSTLVARGIESAGSGIKRTPRPAASGEAGRYHEGTGEMPSLEELEANEHWKNTAGDDPAMLRAALATIAKQARDTESYARFVDEPSLGSIADQCEEIFRMCEAVLGSSTEWLQ